MDVLLGLLGCSAVHSGQHPEKTVSVVQQTTILTYFFGLPAQLLHDSRRQK